MVRKSKSETKASKGNARANMPHGNSSRRWALRITALVLSLLVAEGLLRLACYFSPSMAVALSPPSKVAALTLVVPDNRLKVRGDPRVPEHDPLGFRNPNLPETSPLVTIGDSQTYGTSVDWREAWPKQLEHRAGLATYNMGCSSWGPVEYRDVLTEALKFKPKVVLLGLYFGNDIFDAYRDSYSWPTGADLCDPKQREPIQELERRDPIMERIGKLAQATMLDAPTVTSQGAPSPTADAMPIDRFGKLSALAIASWKTASGLKRRSEDELWQQTLGWAKKRPADLVVFDDGRFRTVLTPAYRGIAVNREDLRIQEGERIAQKVIQQMDERCKASGANLLVVLIPTKEFVYGEVASEAAKCEDYAKLLRDEQAATHALTHFMSEQGIAFVEALPGMRDCFRNGLNPYLPAADGHPGPAGHQAIAAAIAEHPVMKELK